MYKRQLQYWGTEVCRNGFHDDIWISALENKLRNSKDDVVISDCRFPNEIKSIRDAGGIVIRVKRGPEPDWYRDAADMNAGDHCINWALASNRMRQLGIHASETAWVGTKFDHVLENDSSIDNLYAQVRSLIKSPELEPLDASERPLYVGLVDNWHTPS